MSSNFIIDPYYFQDENQCLLSVNSKRYQEKLCNYFFSTLRRQNMNYEHKLQNGVSTHMARETM